MDHVKVYWFALVWQSQHSAMAESQCQSLYLAVTVYVNLFAEVGDNRMHPARSAPRCLPCDYQDPLLGSSSSNEFDAPKVTSRGWLVHCCAQCTDCTGLHGRQTYD